MSTQRAAERISEECLGESDGFHHHTTFDLGRCAKIIADEYQPTIGALEKRIAELEADRDRLREVLEDYGKHGQDCCCWNDPVVEHSACCANCDCGLAAALSATGGHEHPDTVRLQSVRDILDEQEDSWRNAGAAKLVRETGITAVQDIRSAIDALKEAGRG